LRAYSGRETVVVSPASSAAFGIGIGLIVVGAAAVAIGGLALLGATLGEDPNSPSGPPYSALGVVGGGLVAEAGGIALVVLNASSRVAQMSILRPSGTSSSGLFTSEVPHRGAPVPWYPRPVSWPLLRLAF
jgi:hypothetical protein